MAARASSAAQPVNRSTRRAEESPSARRPRETPARLVIGPQPGPQTTFLSTPADIAIYGGAAGGGKSWALLLEPLRHVSNPQFGAVFFRRTTVQIRNEGGLWDESEKLYQQLGASGSEHALSWVFPSGAEIKFAHLEYDKNRFDWQGSQIPLICFDELTHFSEKQFWYMLSRNRSMCGVRPYVRASTNPDADSWVAKLISWWIDEDTGLAIPSRAGVLRWFVRVNDKLVWANEKETLLAQFPDIPPKSLTFIPSKLSDNQKLMEADPGYKANLMSLPTVERERLMEGNWKIRAAAGLLFKREWCGPLVEPENVPRRLVIKRGYDLAATEKTELNDPDQTATTKIGCDPETGIFYILHYDQRFGGPLEVETHIKATAARDTKDVEINLPQDPGQAGKAQVQAYARMLNGYTFRATVESGDKVTRFNPFSAQVKAGNVRVVRGEWNDDFFDALEAFPEGRYKDGADATARAYGAFLENMKGENFLNHVRQQMAEREKAKVEAATQYDPQHFVKLRPPAGITSAMGMRGDSYSVQPDGFLYVAKGDALALQRAGFALA